MEESSGCGFRAQRLVRCTAALSLAVVAGCGEGSATPRDGSVPTDAAADGATMGDDGDTPLDDGGAPSDWWKPTADKPIHWHWQLTGDFEVPRDVLPGVTVYDIDGETATAETVAALHALGPDIKVICYFDAGVYEDYRSDKQMFIDAGLTDGPEDIGWDGSWWIDIRKLDVLMPILRHRVKDWCADKGFDAIEPDETEVWSNWNEQRGDDKITKAENNTFNKAVADLAHEFGLSVGLKGNNTEAGELVQYFDWALTEECFEYEECDNFYDSFIAANKAVFNVEYESKFKSKPQCADANDNHMNSAYRDLDVTGPTDGAYEYVPCVADNVDTWP